MKKIELPPEQIIIPLKTSDELEVAQPAILQIYFRVYETGKGEILPPVVVAHKDKIDHERLLKEYTPDDQEYAERVYRKIMDAKPEYLLLDGNHRAIASTLCHIPINWMEIETDEDVQDAKLMPYSGKLFSFPHEENTLAEITKGFVWYACRNIDSEGVTTVKKRVVNLSYDRQDKLPGYMKDRYINK